MSVTAQALNEALELAFNNPTETKYVESFKRLLNSAADPNFVDDLQVPGIKLATMKRRMDLVKIFLEHPHVQKDAQDASGETALFAATELKDLPNKIPGTEFVKVLAPHISLLQQNSKGKTVLTAVRDRIQRNSESKDPALQKIGNYLKTIVLPALEPLEKQELLNRELYEAVVVEQSIPKVKPLVERGANINWVNFETGNTCLIDLIQSHNHTDMAIFIVDSANELGLDFSTFGCQSPQTRLIIASILDGYKLCDYILAAHERDCAKFEKSGVLAQNDLDEIVRDLKVPGGRAHYLAEKKNVKLMLEAYISITNNIRVNGMTPKASSTLKQATQDINEQLSTLKKAKENYLKSVAQDHVSQTVKAVVQNGGPLGDAHSEQAVNRFRFHANPQTAIAANMKRPAGPAPVPPQRSQQGSAVRTTTKVK